MGEGLTPAHNGATRSDAATYLVAAVGTAASITLLFLAMRAVLDIGGSCADGGPYDISTSCPDGVPFLMTVAFPALFVFGGLMAYRGARLGEGYAAAVRLAWPALFLLLGWNFFQYGMWPPDGNGVAAGWLVCAAVLAAIGVGPLAFGLTRLPAVARHRFSGADAGRLGVIAACLVAGAALGMLLFRLFAA